MLTLILIVAGAVGISSLCSLTEAALYAVPLSSIERMRGEGRRSGEVLHSLRMQVSKPIAAVVTLNTLVNTAGAVVAGMVTTSLLGPEHMSVFVLIFSFLILMFGEIIPKTLGVVHANLLAPLLAVPLHLLTRFFAPLIWFFSLINRLLLPKDSHRAQATEADIMALVSLSRKEGVIRPAEEAIIGNILDLDQKRVRDIMTPRPVVFSLPVAMSLEEAYAARGLWNFSRIPLYAENNEDLIGIVSRRTLDRHLASGDMRHTLGELMQPIHFVLENLPLHELLKQFLNSRTHLFAVLDEFGGLAGVVSLEDVLEEILGREIVDESDPAMDMQALARQRRGALIAAGATRKA
ncbi:MAG: hemolysin family protein [Deltaproteobacteria bacterium]|jgi:CBS domain containing-hemolysin-like protein|nr:hemolysin family protein [Deltaproteobacteria bacterium]